MTAVPLSEVNSDHRGSPSGRERCEVCRLAGGGQVKQVVSMRFSVCEVQPVPYEPCRGRPDSQPAPPRLPPGCGSRSRSSPSAGGPPPPRTPGLRHTSPRQKSAISISGFGVKRALRTLPTHVGSRRLLGISRTGRRGRACSGRSPPWSRAQTCGAAAGWGKGCQVAEPGRTGWPEGCHVGPTGQATDAENTNNRCSLLKIQDPIVPPRCFAMKRMEWWVGSLIPGADRKKVLDSLHCV